MCECHTLEKSMKTYIVFKAGNSFKVTDVQNWKLCCQLKMRNWAVSDGGIARKAVEHFLPVGTVLRVGDSHDESSRHHDGADGKHDAGHHLIWVSPRFFRQFQIARWWHDKYEGSRTQRALCIESKRPDKVTEWTIPSAVFKKTFTKCVCHCPC